MKAEVYNCCNVGRYLIVRISLASCYYLNVACNEESIDNLALA